MLTEFTHISFPLENTGLTLSNQITMHRRWVVTSPSVLKFLEATRSFTVPRETWYVSGIQKGCFLRAAWSTITWSAVFLVTVEAWRAKRLQNKEDASVHISSLPIRVLVCSTVTQKPWVARISFSLINDMTRRCLQTVILNFSWLSFPSVAVLHPLHHSSPLGSFGIHSLLAAAGVYHSSFAILLVSMPALCVLITVAFSAAAVKRT